MFDPFLESLHHDIQQRGGTQQELDPTFAAQRSQKNNSTINRVGVSPSLDLHMKS